MTALTQHRFAARSLRMPEASRWSTRWSLTAPARLARMVIQQAVLFPAVGSLTAPLRVHGRQHAASLAGPAIVVANHSSHLDAPLVLRALPRRLRDRLAVGAAEDYFFGSWVRALPAALVLNAVPVPRSGRRAATALARCGALLEDGWSLLLFPEGTRSPDGALGSLRTGAARLAAAHGVPLLPVYLHGTAHALPKGAALPHPSPVTVTFGSPLHIPREVEPHVATTVIDAALRALAGR